MDRKNILIIFSALTFMTFLIPMKTWGQFGTLNQQKEKTQYGILSSGNGRFVFGQISDSGKDKFMLDTFSGRLWRMTESGGVGLYFIPVPYQIELGEYANTPEIMPRSGEVEKK